MSRRPGRKFFEAVAGELEGAGYVTGAELAGRFPGMDGEVAAWLLSKKWRRLKVGELSAAGAGRPAWLYCSPSVSRRGLAGILRRERASLRRVQAELDCSNERHPVNSACRRMVLARMAASYGLLENGGRPASRRGGRERPGPRERAAGKPRAGGGGAA